MEIKSFLSEQKNVYDYSMLIDLICFAVVVKYEVGLDLSATSLLHNKRNP